MMMTMILMGREKRVKKSYLKTVDRDLLVSSYDYQLPKELIATSPATPADSAKLLVYNRETKEIKDVIS